MRFTLTAIIVALAITVSVQAGLPKCAVSPLPLSLKEIYGDVEWFPIHRIAGPRVFQHVEKKAFVVLHRVPGILKQSYC